MIPATTKSNAPLVPELRQDLRLHPGPAGAGGSSWIVYDPVRHRYFQLSRAAFDLLVMWRTEPADELAKRAQDVLDRPVTAEEVNEVAKFIIANNLALEPPQGNARSLAAQQSKGLHKPIRRILHGYLFFKIPLVRPERFLLATKSFVAPLYTRTAAISILIVSLAGLYLVSRQWERFLATFLDFFSLEGLLVYGVALIFVKSLHELGHAYTATLAGVRVNTMGVAFIVLTPILYTDVSDAWRLPQRRQKLAIDAAGIVVELALAGIALFLWAFLPDGPWRSAAFVTATTSLLIGLMINLNPLMRFDGYYLLSDGWNIPNLQSRSNAMARWWLREALFGLGYSPGEQLPRRQRALMIAYALCTWVYRFFLFLGIALVVYYMFFKVLGVILFAVEIIWFILLPVLKEIREWWKMRGQILRTRRTLVTAALTASLIAVLVVPWSGTVAIQAVALRGLETRIYAPRSAHVVSVAFADRQNVEAGNTLLILSAPDLDHDLRKTQLMFALTQLRLDRIAGDLQDLSQRVVLEGELSRHRTGLAGLELERDRLHIRAPHAGIVRDADRDLRPGEWIDDTTPIARVVGSTAVIAQGYLNEEDFWRIEPGSAAVFIPEDPVIAKRTGRITEVVATGVDAIDLPYLASVYGGAVPTDRSKDGEIKPRSGHHLARIQLDGPPVERAIRGTLHLAAKPESFVATLWRRILKVLVRESSA